ncbi:MULTISPECIES: circadian clock KaiB family protein [Nostoc]|uniref:Circadian clock protein KaiB n=1 Tax=Nostoc paludosum FACHB-159 TaxID=2692908 RepID=A0ABR8KK32_9NOSO|nr:MULTISPECIES: circadian clock KaiB family protein [Nostoc]MBD2682159.1 circadian clock protein KaiB [Nostoc sp. FACHB-857]MBD2738487.1 circadian clock protein KaiB [Nostoc paludosum FACHB-159]
MNNLNQSNENYDEMIIESTEEFEKMIAKKDLEKYVLRLYVAGNSLRSMRAIAMLKKICEKYLSGHYEIEIIDIYQQPEVLEKDHVFAVPTLIKELPPPLQKLIGDLTNVDKVIVALDIA